MRISDWSSDVCSSDLYERHIAKVLQLSGAPAADAAKQAREVVAFETRLAKASKSSEEIARDRSLFYNPISIAEADRLTPNFPWSKFFESQGLRQPKMFSLGIPARSEEHTSELQSLMRISYAVFCLKKKT